MNIDITGRKVSITQGLRDFTEEKLAKIQRLFDDPLEAHVVIWVNKRRHCAEIQIKTRQVLLSSTKKTDDLYVSIGEVVDKLERQALKQIAKGRGHKHRRGPRDPDIAAAISANAAEEARPDDGGPADEDGPRRIVRRRRYRVKPMSPEDAVMELEASREDLLVFRESDNYRINVVYREKSGNYALIDPDL